MTLIAIILCTLVAVLLWIHLRWSIRFREIYKTRLPALRDAELPRVLVVLSLRGADPSLNACLEGLFRQNYPAYTVRIVVDSREDPAWRVVERAIHDCEARHVEMRVLEKRSRTCGLKNSALLQEFSDPDGSWDVVAQLDADTIPYPNWLRDLVTPLADRSVGATTGLRCYAPVHTNAGSQVRAMWNAAAVVQMAMFRIAWGGSMAFQARLFREPYMIQNWSRMLWEDTFTLRAMNQLGLKLQFVPEATMLNCEKTNLRNCFRYITRQILNVRLYHDYWPWILAYGLCSTLLPVVMSLVVVAATIMDLPVVAAITGASLACHLTGVAVVVVTANRTIRKTVMSRGEPTWSPTFAPELLLFAAMTPLVYFASMLSAVIARQIEWRGIRYRILGPSDIRMLEYHPMVQQTDSLSL